MGRIATFLSAFTKTKSEEENEIKVIVANREKILKEYGNKMLLVETMAEKEFEKINQTGLRAKVKASNNGGASTSKSAKSSERNIKKEAKEEELDREDR